MNLEKKERLYKHLFIKYGIEKQFMVAMEEMSELIKELSKYCRGTQSSIKSEIADVEIMLDEIKFILKLDKEEIEAEKEVKLIRQIEREKL